MRVVPSKKVSGAGLAEAVSRIFSKAPNTPRQGHVRFRSSSWNFLRRFFPRAGPGLPVVWRWSNVLIGDHAHTAVRVDAQHRRVEFSPYQLNQSCTSRHWLVLNTRTFRFRDAFDVEGFLEGVTPLRKAPMSAVR